MAYVLDMHTLRLDESIMSLPQPTVYMAMSPLPTVYNGIRCSTGTAPVEALQRST